MGLVKRPSAPRSEELKACPVCGSTRSAERFVSADLLLSVPGAFRYVDCAACGTVYQNPRVREEDLPLCYPAEYYTHDSRPDGDGRPPAAGSLRGLLKRAIRSAADEVADRELATPIRLAGRLLALFPALRYRARPGLVDGLAPSDPGRRRCLEVGPGRGLDLGRLRALGWETCGLEADPVAAQAARESSGCEVRVGTLASTDYPPGGFDLVYMSHVAEHLPDPVGSMRRCLDLLSPGGRLVIVCPNPASLTARVYGRFSAVWEPPRHLVLAPPAAFASLLKEIGFEGIRMGTTSRHAAEHNAASRALRSGRSWSWSRPHPSTAADRLFGLVEALAVSLGWEVGEEMIVRARKPAGPS
jgi:SAM-dependent methyltransferase